MSRHASYPEGLDDADQAFLDSFPGIPDGSFVQGFVTIVTYVTPDGSNAWMLHQNVDLPASQTIGLLACAQTELMARTPGLITGLSPGLDEDDDDD